MRNAKEEIDYQKRKFVFHLCGTDTTGGNPGDCVFNFTIPSPNEVANSNNYNQCLIKIKSAYLNNCRDNDGGLNSVFTEISTSAAPNAVRLAAAGCYLKSNIASNNCFIRSATTLEQRGGVGCILHTPDQQYKGSNAVGGIAAPGGSSVITLGAGAGGVAGANPFGETTFNYLGDNAAAAATNTPASLAKLNAKFFSELPVQSEP